MTSLQQKFWEAATESAVRLAVVVVVVVRLLKPHFLKERNDHHG